MIIHGGAHLLGKKGTVTKGEERLCGLTSIYGGGVCQKW